jgi:uncharacterized protein involved in exopolysaccharide biosynthesis
MSSIPAPIRDVQKFWLLLRASWKTIIWTTVVVAVVAVLFALFRPATWEATQALIVRNEAALHDTNPGKFRQPEEMKTVQETILELVKSRGVIAAALQEVGPPADHRQPAANWPDERDLVGVQKNVKLSAPKGAEFGKTEVFYLEVRANDRERAIALNRAICEQLQRHFQRIRHAKAESMVAELEKTVQLARADLAASTARLTALEAEVGSDLAELRSMGDHAQGESSLRRTITEIRSELRDVRTAARHHAELLALLRAAQDDPGQLLAAPNRLLESQPALRRLKEGLIDYQMNSARLEGSMSDEHPLVKAAQEVEAEIGRRLHNELAIAIRGLEVETRLAAQRETLLEEQLVQATRRLEYLAALRASYANQLAENTHRTLLAERAENNLAEARAAQASARAASLITPIDEPHTGPNPIGPSRKMVILLGVMAGLLSGVGLVVLAADKAEHTAKGIAAEAAFPAVPPCPTPLPPTSESHPAGNKGNISGNNGGNQESAAGKTPSTESGAMSLQQALRQIANRGLWKTEQ